MRSLNRPAFLLIAVEGSMGKLSKTGKTGKTEKTGKTGKAKKQEAPLDWRNRAEISADVVFFSYRPDRVEMNSKEVFLWDLDKTYLDTRFESFSGLLKTAFEKAFQKKNVPGTSVLVKSLADHWKLRFPGQSFPIYFITGSPPQMEKKIAEKVKLDGVEPFGIFCKDNLQNLRPKRLWRLTQQIGYKIQALMQLRLHLQEEVKQVLWGDDSESDAIIYSLYSDICSRRLEEKDIRQVLKSLHVIGSQLDAILALQEQIPTKDPVSKVYINLAEDTDAEYYQKFGSRTVPTFNSFQTSLDLFQDERLVFESVHSVAKDLVKNYGFTMDQLEFSFDDLVRRGVLRDRAVGILLPLLKSAKILNQDFALSISPKPDWVSSPSDSESSEVWIPDRIDYLHDYR